MPCPTNELSALFPFPDFDNNIRFGFAATVAEFLSPTNRVLFGLEKAKAVYGNVPASSITEWRKRRMPKDI